MKIFSLYTDQENIDNFRALCKKTKKKQGDLFREMMERYEGQDYGHIKIKKGKEITLTIKIEEEE